MQKKMAVLSGKSIAVMGFLFYGILKKLLAQNIRNVDKSEIDV